MTEPNLVDPPPPDHAKPLRPGELTPDLAAWAMAVDTDPATYPLGTQSERDVGEKRYLARVVQHTTQARTGKHGLFHAVEIWRLEDDAPRVPHLEQPSPLALGVDVSDYQRGADFAKVAAAGYSFAYVKMTEGASGPNSTQQYAKEHWQSAGDAGMLRGAYHFFRSATSMPLEQAHHFFEVALSMPGMAELPPMIDVEWQHPEPRALDGVSPKDFVERVLTIVEAVTRLFGRKPFLYTAPGFWSYLASAMRPELAERTLLWQAQYGSKAQPLGPWPNWMIWQFSDQAAVPGIPGRADVNRFAGDVATLRAFAKSGGIDEDTLRRFTLLADSIDAGAEGLPPSA